MKACVKRIKSVKKEYLLFFFLLSFSLMKAQQKNVIGIKAGNYFGVFYKYYLKDVNSAELTFSKYSSKNQVSLIFINHSSLNYADTFRLNYGTGVHYDWNGDKKHVDPFGLDGIVGVEYSIPKSKFIVGLQWHPQFIINYQGNASPFLFNYYTLNVNYILN